MTVAEGIEQAGELTELRRLGGDLAQGYLPAAKDIDGILGARTQAR